VTGRPGEPVDIPPGGSQSFVITLTPTAPVAPTDVQFAFACANGGPAPVGAGINTLAFSASDAPVPDVVALAATTTGDGIVNVSGTTGVGAFAVATTNLGAGGAITTAADSGAPGVSVSVCQTDPGSGACISGVGPAVTAAIDPGATPTFAVFVASDRAVSFDPAGHRVVVRFTDAGGITRGATSVAVRTQ